MMMALEKKKKTESDKDDTLTSLDALNEAHDTDPDFQALIDEYGATKPKALADPLTDPMPDAFCKILETWFWGRYSATEIKNEQAKCRRPANANAVIPC